MRSEVQATECRFAISTCVRGVSGRMSGHQDVKERELAIYFLLFGESNVGMHSVTES